MALARYACRAAETLGRPLIPLPFRPPGRGRGVWPLVLLLVMAGTAVSVPLTVFGSSGPETAAVFAKLAWGEGQDQVGLALATEGLTRGPEALAVSPDGRVAILDSVNGRLLLLDQKGTPIGRISLDLASPRFLAVDDESLYVLDADMDKQLVTYSWSGGLTDRADAPQTEEVVTGLFVTTDGPWVESGHRGCTPMGRAAQALAAGSRDGVAQGQDGFLPGRPLDRDSGRLVSATFRPGEGLRLQTHAAGAPEAKPDDSGALTPSLAAGRAIDHLVSIDSDGRGGLLIGAKLLIPEKRGDAPCALAITRLRADAPGQSQGGAGRGRPDEVLLLAESDFAFLGSPYVVAPDGRIFQPVADQTGYSILVHSFQEVQP